MPDSGFKKVWDIIIIIILLYTGTYVPYRTAFLDGSTSDALFAFELIVDVLFLGDVVVTFFTPYERIDGSFETRHKKIAKNYVLGAFAIDVVACLPT